MPANTYYYTCNFYGGRMLTGCLPGSLFGFRISAFGFWLGIPGFPPFNLLTLQPSNPGGLLVGCSMFGMPSRPLAESKFHPIFRHG